MNVLWYDTFLYCVNFLIVLYDYITINKIAIDIYAKIKINLFYIIITNWAFLVFEMFLIVDFETMIWSVAKIKDQTYKNLFISMIHALFILNDLIKDIILRIITKKGNVFIISKINFIVLKPNVMDNTSNNEQIKTKSSTV